MSRRWLRGFAAGTLGLALLAGSAAPALADHLQRQVVASPLTQTHTIFFNTISCPAGEGIAIINWTTRFQRVAGSNRDLDQVKYRVAIDGVDCSTRNAGRDTGVLRYGPHFGASNDITWQQTLNWPAIVPILWGAASAQRGYYTQRGGGPYVQYICTNITLANGGQYCPLL